MEGLFILFAYTVVILFLTIDDRADGSKQYNTGGGKLSPLSGSLSIAAAWIWAPAFFVSSERGYLYGWQGLAWFIVPNVLCLLLFAPFADELLRAVLVHAGMGKFKASLVYNSVRLFGKSAYEDDDKLTETNSELFTFEWSGENG